MMERLQLFGVVLLAIFGLIIASPLLIVFALFGVLVLGYWYITGDMTITVKDNIEKGE